MKKQQPLHLHAPQFRNPQIAAPGGVYLCQVDENVSCGACCGLYNVADADRHALERILRGRTARMAQVRRTVEDLTAFGRGESRNLEPGPYSGFHHCPYVGLIGTRQSRIGCLLHPMADGNAGVDYRGLSYYGGMACREYFCPSHRMLPPDIKIIVRGAVRDWYRYGLLITEAALLRAFFNELDRRLTCDPQAVVIAADRRCRQALNAFLDLKFQWPFQRSKPPHICNYFFEDRQYRRPPVDYSATGAEGSRFDSIFRPLGATFDCPDQLAAAEKLLEKRIAQVARAFETCRPRPLTGKMA